MIEPLASASGGTTLLYSSLEAAALPQARGWEAAGCS